MSAASRAAEEAAVKFASMKSRQTKIGICPVCEDPIHLNQPTAWRSVDGVTSRVHDQCKDPS